MDFDIIFREFDEFNKKHEGIATATIVFNVKMPMFEKNQDEYMQVIKHADNIIFENFKPKI